MNGDSDTYEAVLTELRLIRRLLQQCCDGGNVPTPPQTCTVEQLCQQVTSISDWIIWIEPKIVDLHTQLCQLITDVEDPPSDPPNTTAKCPDPPDQAGKPDVPKFPPPDDD